MRVIQINNIILTFLADKKYLCTSQYACWILGISKTHKLSIKCTFNNNWCCCCCCKVWRPLRVFWNFALYTCSRVCKSYCVIGNFMISVFHACDLGSENLLQKSKIIKNPLGEEGGWMLSISHNRKKIASVFLYLDIYWYLDKLLK